MAFTATGDPVISVDTKKKKLIGNFSMRGREWEPQGEPTNTASTTSSTKLAKVGPYGVYDVGSQLGRQFQLINGAAIAWPISRTRTVKSLPTRDTK